MTYREALRDVLGADLADAIIDNMGAQWALVAAMAEIADQPDLRQRESGQALCAIGGARRDVLSCKEAIP